MTRYAKVIWLAVVLMSIAAIMWAQDIDVPPSEPDAPEQIDKPERTLGVLFSADSILLDVGPYEAGVGMAFFLPEDSWRVSLTSTLSNLSSTIAAELGVARISYTRSGRVAPYWVLSANAGVLTQVAETDADNWTRTTTINGSAGAGFGAEFFVFEFLSIFADYQLIAQVSRQGTRTALAGEITAGEPTWSYTVQTAMGNSSRLGVAIYLDPVIEIEPLWQR